MHLITQCTETTYFRCRHYTQYYQARIFFFHFITSLTIYVHLITISRLRQFPPVVYISLYLFIFRFFFHLITPKHYPEHSHQICSFLIHLFFHEFLGGCSPSGTATFLRHQTHGRPALPTCGPPMAPPQRRKNTGFPRIRGRLWQYPPSHTGTS